MTQELKMKKMKMNIEPLMLGPGLAVLCVNPHRFIHSEMCFKTVTSYVCRTMDRPPSSRMRVVSPHLELDVVTRRRERTRDGVHSRWIFPPLRV